jgi:hypothetical protein
MNVWLCLAPAALPTPGGLVPVGRLCAGDAVLGEGGEVLTLGAVGRLVLSAGELAGREGLWPVHLGERVVLPGYPVGGIAAMWLVDGGAVRRPVPAGGMEVYSLELEGAPAGGVCVAADAPAGRPVGRPVGRPADAALFAARRGAAVGEAGRMVGSLDRVGREGIEGWASDELGRGVALEVVVDGVASVPFVAELMREDLAAAGFGDGRRGFVRRLELGPGAHLVRVRRAVDGVDVPGSPAVIEAVPGVAAVLRALPRDAAALALLRAVTRAGGSR